MFPLQRSCELSFQLSQDKDGGGGHDSDPNPQQYHFVSDFPHPKLLQPGSCTQSLNPPIINADDDDDRRAGRRRSEGRQMDSSKKIVHRETERQRRLEMATHYSSLRDLLPDNYAKGKRSMSDHIMEAGNYINDLRRRIQSMESKREKLKGSGGVNIRAGESHVVLVERCSEGLEIKICCQQIPLSRLISVIVEEGLDVFNCVSTKVKCRLIHVLHAQMKDNSYVDPYWLERRLLNEIWSHDSQFTCVPTN